MALALTDDQGDVEKMRAEFQRRGLHMHRRLITMPGVRCLKPTGAFNCFPDVSYGCMKLGISSSTEFANHLLAQTKVAVVPGVAFGMDRHIRLSFAANMEQIDEGLTWIEEFLRV